MLPLWIGCSSDVTVLKWTWLDDLRPVLDIVTNSRSHRILWPYKDVDAYEESRCEELLAITFTFHRAMCAWVQVQNIALTRSQRFIILLLWDVRWCGNLERIIIHTNTFIHINKQIIHPLLHVFPSLSHNTHAFPGALGFILSEHWSFVIMDMISHCTDISSGSSDGSGVEDGWRVGGGSVRLQLVDENQMKDRKHR